MASTNTIDLGGNTVILSNIRINSDNPGITSTGTATIYAGAGAPSFLATQGSLYLNTTGSSTSTRAYINTTGSTVWTAITTVA